MKQALQRGIVATVPFATPALADLMSFQVKIGSPDCNIAPLFPKVRVFPSLVDESPWSAEGFKAQRANNLLAPQRVVHRYSAQRLNSSTALQLADTGYPHSKLDSVPSTGRHDWVN